MTKPETLIPQMVVGLDRKVRHDEFQCDFSLTERDIKLYDYATRYHIECEEYDRTVCTGQIGRDGIMPATPHEMARINRNAQAVRKRILFDAERDGLIPDDVTRAIRTWSGRVPNVD